MNDDSPAQAPLYPVARTYPLVTLTEAPEADPFPPRRGGWDEAIEAHTFFEKGRPEAAERRSSFRMLRSADRLFVAIDCSAGDATGVADESVELYFTQSDRADFPYIVIQVTSQNKLSPGSIARPYTWWARPPIDPIPSDAIHHQVTVAEDGWSVLLSIPLASLGIPPEGFYFNVVRRSADGSAYAWCDLFGGPPSQVEVLGRALPALPRPPETWQNDLQLPAELAVGINHLRLVSPDPGVVVRMGERTFPTNEAGEVLLPVLDRGPVDVELVTAEGAVVASYHADVPRPFLIHATEPFLPAGAKEFGLEVTLNLAGDGKVPVTVSCRRQGRKPEEHQLSLRPGRHTVALPVPPGEPGEVAVEAKATPANNPNEGPGSPALQEVEALPLLTRHWFVVGGEAEEFDVYREDIRSLPTDRMYWAVVADAVGYVRLRQAGTGAYGRPGRSQSSVWQQAFVYPVALLYKTEHPDNPWTGDRRLLESAVLGMEFALRPEVSKDEHIHPDNRSLQAYLLTYELLKDDVEPGRRDYWAYELQHRAEGVVARWLRPLALKQAMYSADCGTGTNHMAYHVANVALAGEVFDRAEWRELGRDFMHRLARHGPEGHFEERAGVPVNHYTWLSANALGEYYWRTRDPDVKQTLDACARYMSAITTAEGNTMSLHDGRAAAHRPFYFGDFVLSLTPQGRAAARARLLGIVRDRPSRISLELLWRCAENARYFQPGPEAELFSADDELVFSRGTIVRRSGFHYALSTVCLGPITGSFRLDPQNVVELFHKDVGCILNGCNSQRQPEAGTFLRKLTQAELANVPSAPRVDYLPITASISKLTDGHDVTLSYWSFEARVAVYVLSPTQARLVVTAQGFRDDDPVVFNFFPGVRSAEELRAHAQTLRFRGVTLEANRVFHVEHDFRTMNPYQMEFTYHYKPVRCWLQLDPGETFVLDIRIGSDPCPAD